MVPRGRASGPHLSLWVASVILLLACAVAGPISTATQSTPLFVVVDFPKTPWIRPTEPSSFRRGIVDGVNDKIGNRTCAPRDAPCDAGGFCDDLADLHGKPHFFSGRPKGSTIAGFTDGYKYDQKTEGNICIVSPAATPLTSPWDYLSSTPATTSFILPPRADQPLGDFTPPRNDKSTGGNTPWQTIVSSTLHRSICMLPHMAAGYPLLLLLLLLLPLPRRG